MEFKFTKMSVALPDGVDANKFGALRAVAVTPEEIKKTFNKHGYNLKEVPGIFLKAFAMNEKELAEIENNLLKIEKMGMKTIFENNLRLRYFRDKFINKLEKCMSTGLPYLNQDNTFASFFDSEETFENYISKNESMSTTNENASKNNVTNEVIENKNLSNKETNQEMTPEDKQVYNEIVRDLNYLVLANPLDTGLAAVVNNATNKVVDAINRKEYRFIGIREMVKSIMFDGLEVPISDKERIENLVLGAFPDEERKLG